MIPELNKSLNDIRKIKNSFKIFKNRTLLWLASLTLVEVSIVIFIISQLNK